MSIKMGRRSPSQPQAANTPLRQHSRSLSLEAFQDLITQRASLVVSYLSLRADSSFPGSDESIHDLHSQGHEKSELGSCPEPLRDNTMRRSIATISDCSDDDVREDEGWIPIAWEDYCYSLPPPHILSHKRSISCYSTASSSYTEVFSGEEWSPPMTPVSPDFGVETYEALNKVPNDAYIASYGRPGCIENTTRWILKSDNVY
jgi:hypothetical protein